MGHFNAFHSIYVCVHVAYMHVHAHVHLAVHVVNGCCTVLALTSGLPCLPLTVENSNATLLEAEHLTVVRVACDDGYEIDVGVEWFDTQCLGNRTWSQYRHCNGAYTCACAAGSFIRGWLRGIAYIYILYIMYSTCTYTYMTTYNCLV